MSDMELVIKIPEWQYKSICEGVEASKRCGVVGIDPNIHEAIYNGTPLPKGHGRLIDADALKKDDEVTEWLSLNAVRTGEMLKSFSELFIKKIDNTPTIIEADKEYKAEVITRGNCMMCGKELTEGLFFCKECEAKVIQNRE